MKRTITAWELRAGDIIHVNDTTTVRVMKAIQDPEDCTVYVQLYYGNSSHMPASKSLIVSREDTLGSIQNAYASYRGHTITVTKEDGMYFGHISGLDMRDQLSDPYDRESEAIAEAKQKIDAVLR